MVSLLIDHLKTKPEVHIQHEEFLAPLVIDCLVRPIGGTREVTLYECVRGNGNAPR